MITEITYHDKKFALIHGGVPSQCKGAMPNDLRAIDLRAIFHHYDA
jgi:hypothetical protein